MREKGVERKSRLATKAEIRRKNESDYFVFFSRWHRAWLHELAERYKMRGEFPMLPILILPSYYTDVRDMEIAAFASLLVKSNAEFGHINELRELIGVHPWQWFEQREFVLLSIGDAQRERTGGVENWKLAKLMSRIWDEIYYVNGGVDEMGIFEMIRFSARLSRISYFEVLTWLIEDCGVSNYFYKLRLLLMVLGTSDGIGAGVWDVGQEYLKCPWAEGLRRFVGTWFPNYSRIGTLDDAIALFGFERDSDFFYAYMGYCELQRIDPNGCGLYATRYNSWYSHGSTMKRYRWVGIQPEIPF